jgi:hypothetical protein
VAGALHLQEGQAARALYLAGWKAKKKSKKKKKMKDA